MKNWKNRTVGITVGTSKIKLGNGRREGGKMGFFHNLFTAEAPSE